MPYGVPLQSERICWPWGGGWGSPVCRGVARDVCSLAPSLSCACSLVCVTEASGKEVAGAVTVEVPGRGRGVSELDFAYQVPDRRAPPAANRLPPPLDSSQPTWFHLPGPPHPPAPGPLCLPQAPPASVPGLTPVCLPLSPFPQDPKVHSVFPTRGPRAGGTHLTLRGSKLLTGRLEDIRVVVGDQPCHL